MRIIFPRQKSADHWAILNLYGSILILLLSICFLYLKSDFLSAIISVCLFIGYALILRALFKPLVINKERPSYFTPELLFLSFYFLLFLLPYQFYMLDMLVLEDSRLISTTFPEQSQNAILLSTVGMIAFAIGIDGPRSIEDIKNTPNPPRLLIKDPGKLLDVTLFILLIASIGIYIGAGFRNANEFRYTAGDVTAGSGANVYDLITFFSMAISAQFARKLRGRRLNVFILLSVVIIAIWSMRILIAGDRNSFFLIAAAMFGALSFHALRIRRIVLLGSIPLVILLYNAVEIVRRDDNPTLNKIASEMLSGTETRTDPNDSSFYGTTISLRAALAVVPERTPYALGKYEGIELLGIFPFIRGYILPDNMRYTRSSDLLTETVLGPFANWGVGTSVPADIYVDFGVFGVVVIMFGIGRVGRWIQTFSICYPNRPLPQILVVVATAMYLEYPRYAAMFPVKYIVWSILIVWTLNLVKNSAVKGLPVNSKR